MRYRLTLMVLFLLLAAVTSTIWADTLMREIRMKPMWSPDGQHIAYMASDGIHVMRADGHDDRLVAPPSGFGGWTGDSRHLLIIENRYPEEAAIAWWQYPLDGSEPERLLAELDLIHALAYSHDGERIAVSAQRSETDPMMIWIAKVDGSDLTSVAELSSFEMAWSADDESILVRTRLEDGDLLRDALVSIDFGNPQDQDITYLSDDDSTVKFSEMLAFRYDETDSYAPFTYFVTDFLLEGESLLTLDEVVPNIVYAAHTQTVAFTVYCDAASISQAFLSGEWSADEQAQTETALYLFDVASTSATEVVSCGAGSQMSLSFSPDGQQIAFIGINDDQWDVYRLDIADNSLHNLTDADS